MFKTGRHVVLVEDAPDTLELFGMMLGNDYDITQCSSCADALTVVQRTTPDILLMDIGMFDMDGIECLRQIRALPGLQDIPAIAVTAFAFPADRKRCYDAGFQDFIAKPILDYEEMRRLIEDVLKRQPNSGKA
jgi:CheY-like chemotaxis protein